ncbi:uncharacterized protein LOC135488408 [Lineus longissimus]|uniref:uncharacterized protein LOC135488408 n=1 Tax=Lineus longissimus TaxID=88925 RepID=UPI002B4DBA38
MERCRSSHVHHHNKDWHWTSCTLCRANKQGEDVYRRACQRKIEWPKPKLFGKNPVKDQLTYTSIDDAFSSMLHYMSIASRQCNRFYKGCPESHLDCKDKYHCNRFHTPQYTEVQHKNPLEMSEDVHVVVHPGTYAVTAGTWGKTQQQTHVVHVKHGQSANIDFVV